MIKIESLNLSNKKQWDEYVNSHSQGTFFHLSGWVEVLEESFNYACYSLIAKNEDTIVGLLPLFEVKSKLYCHALISSPLCVYGGVIANSDEITRILEKEAADIAESLQVDYLELRYKNKQDSQMPYVSKHATFIHPIESTSEGILQSIKKKQRAVIRHSLKNELNAGHTATSPALSKLYNLLSVSYRNLGTPIFSKKYFQKLTSVFSEQCDITLVEDKQGIPSTAVLNFYYKDTVLPYYGGGDVSARRLKSADFMYFQLMCHAQERGCREFDFGRSKTDSGPYRFKKNWGMQPQPLYYYYHLVKSKSIPDVSPNNPKYKFFIKIWQKLPIWLSQRLGSVVSKGLS